jgi:hypothetical protein
MGSNASKDNMTVRSESRKLLVDWRKIELEESGPSCGFIITIAITDVHIAAIQLWRFDKATTVVFGSLQIQFAFNPFRCIFLNFESMDIG